MTTRFGILAAMILICGIMAGAQELPKVVAGKTERIQNLKSAYVDSRNVDVWLPKGYKRSKKYNVLYMHDGQMLYYAASTWNKTAWDVDDVLTKLLDEKKIEDVIVVGIWNGGKTRHPDYFPQKPYEALSEEQKSAVIAAAKANGIPALSENHFNSDNYLKFIVKELKPLIDQKYAVYTDRDHTFIAGSSMGGLISWYAICEYPDVFGGAVCMSTHWPGIFAMEGNPIPDAFVQYISKNLPDPKTHKIYFDYGDQTLDASYPPLQKKVDEVMASKGYIQKNWKTQFFPGKDHSEKSWNERFHIPMEFILSKKQ